MDPSYDLLKLPETVPKQGTEPSLGDSERNSSNNGVARGTPLGPVQTTGEATRRALRPHGARYVLMQCISDKSAHRQRRFGSLFMLSRSAFPGQGPPAGQVLLRHVPLLLLLVLDVV